MNKMVKVVVKQGSDPLFFASALRHPGDDFVCEESYFKQMTRHLDLVKDDVAPAAVVPAKPTLNGAPIAPNPKDKRGQGEPEKPVVTVVKTDAEIAAELVAAAKDGQKKEPDTSML